MYPFLVFLVACGGPVEEEPFPPPVSTTEPSPEPTPEPGNDDWVTIPLQREITQVQPMTGIVLWADSHNGSNLKQRDDVIQLEYAYVRPSDIVIGKNNYDWSTLENLLEQVKTRGKQAIIRWYYVYPGNTNSAVPNYIKDYTDYNETIANSEGQSTAFPDWSHPELMQAHLDFYKAFAEKYDTDPRIAFLQVGFGLWGEYHIYDPGAEFGVNYPSRDFQKNFLLFMEANFSELKWSISIDAGDNSNSPISRDPELQTLSYGNFDDSFMHQNHDGYNENMWNVFDYNSRFQFAPLGGELSYYTTADQRNALNPEGMHGRNFETLSHKFHISYMIGNDQPQYQSTARIKEAGLALGYKFEVTAFQSSQSKSRVTIKNIGNAPIYYDTYPTVNGIQSLESLKDLLPGEEKIYTIASGGSSPVLTINSTRLLDGQEIQFKADI